MNDFRQSFYTMLLWRTCAVLINNKFAMHAPFADGELPWVCATNKYLAVRIKQSACQMPDFLDTVGEPTKMPPVQGLFRDIADVKDEEWLALPRIGRRVHAPVSTEIREEFDPDELAMVERTVELPRSADDFAAFEIQPGVWVDGGKLYWLSLIPGLRFHVRPGQKPSSMRVLFQWEDGQAVLMCLANNEVKPPE